MKRKLTVLSLLVIMAATLASGTIAYFTAAKTAHNVITTGNVEIELLEWADEARQPGDEFENVTGVVSGNRLNKIVEVKNTGEADAWIRVWVDVNITKEGVAQDLTIQDANGQPVDIVALDFNTTEWEKGADGWYYYTLPVAPEEVTEPLFKTVSFHTAMGNAYQNSTVSVDVSASAVQVANNGATVQDAKGWPASNK